jgi:hypothetical protein
LNATGAPPTTGAQAQPAEPGNVAVAPPSPPPLESDAPEPGNEK